MKWRNILTAHLLLALLTAPVSSQVAGSSPQMDPRESLRGASPIVVVVSFNASPAATGILRTVGGTEQAIQNRAELRLRRAAIPLVSAEEARAGKVAAGILRVKVLGTCEGPDLCSLFFDVQFLQQAFLDRNDAASGLFATWMSSNGVMAGRSRFVDAWISLDDILDMFSNQWLSVNPRR